MRRFIIEKLREIRGMVYMAYVMAIISMYLAKMLKSLLALAIYLPDNILRAVAQDTCKTTDGKRIVVQQATNPHGLITNKLKLFMSMYWKEATDTLQRRSGFNVNDYTKQFLTDTLAVIYQCIDEQGNRSTHSMHYANGSQQVDQQEPRKTTHIDLDGRHIELNEWSAAQDEELRKLCGAS